MHGRHGAGRVSSVYYFFLSFCAVCGRRIRTSEIVVRAVIAVWGGGAGLSRTPRALGRRRRWRGYRQPLRTDYSVYVRTSRRQLLRTGSRYAPILCSVYGYVRVETSHSYRTTVQLYSSDCTDSHNVPTTVCTYVRTIDSNTAVQ